MWSWKSNNTLPIYCSYLDVAVNIIKLISVPMGSNSVFPLLCCGDTKYFLSTIQVYIRRHAKCRILLPYFSQVWSFSTDFRVKIRNIFHENPSSGSCADACWQTDERKEETTRITSTSLQQVCNFMIISRRMFLGVRKFSDKILEKIKTHILCSINIFPKFVRFIR